MRLEYLFTWGLISMLASGSTSNFTTKYSISLEKNNLEPYFENTTNRDIIAIIGKTALFYCRVRNLKDRAVSWIRKLDLHILTIGDMTYTNDQRFQAMHIFDKDEWILKIVSVQPHDSGIYECQVSTEPKISQAFHLSVVVSKAKILSNKELFFKSGSNINLTCIAFQAPAPPTFIYWYKDGELINYSQRGGINILTEQLTKTSNLFISRVMPSDSGNYTCIPSNSDSDSVYIHVIRNEHRAAMQHEGCSTITLTKTLFYTALVCSLNHHQIYHQIRNICCKALLQLIFIVSCLLLVG